MSTTPHGRDLYMRHTDTDGRSFVQLHRVWDAERFVAARKAEACSLNADVKGNAPRLALVQQITRDQFLQERTIR